MTEHPPRSSIAMRRMARSLAALVLATGVPGVSAQNPSDAAGPADVKVTAPPKATHVLASGMGSAQARVEPDGIDGMVELHADMSGALPESAGVGPGAATMELLVDGKPCATSEGPVVAAASGVLVPVAKGYCATNTDGSVAVVVEARVTKASGGATKDAVLVTVRGTKRWHVTTSSKPADAK